MLKIGISGGPGDVGIAFFGSGLDVPPGKTQREIDALAERHKAEAAERRGARREEAGLIQEAAGLSGWFRGQLPPGPGGAADPVARRARSKKMREMIATERERISGRKEAREQFVERALTHPGKRQTLLT